MTMQYWPEAARALILLAHRCWASMYCHQLRTKPRKRRIPDACDQWWYCPCPRRGRGAAEQRLSQGRERRVSVLRRVEASAEQIALAQCGEALHDACHVGVVAGVLCAVASSADVAAVTIPLITVTAASGVGLWVCLQSQR